MSDAKEKDNLPAVKGGQEVAVYDYGADEGAGYENVTKDDYALPFLYVLDAKSPQCAPVTAGGIAGARAGSLFNTATREVHDGDKGVPFVPVHTNQKFIEWIPRNEDGSGGGFVGVRAPDDPLVIELRRKHGEFGKLPTPDGHELVQTFELYGLIVPDFDWSQKEAIFSGQGIVAPFKSTAIGGYKQFVTTSGGFRVPMVRDGARALVKPPMWAHVWRIKSKYRPPRSQATGWYVPEMVLSAVKEADARLSTSNPLYIQAKEFYLSIKAGRVVVKHEDERQPGDDKDEIPM